MKLSDSKLGFSVEWEMGDTGKMELRGEHLGKSCYELLHGEITAIALVKNPAIKVKGKTHDDTKTLCGPVMIPDLKIFRREKDNNEFYVYFSGETIKELKEKYDVSKPIKFGH